MMWFSSTLSARLRHTMSWSAVTLLRSSHSPSVTGSAAGVGGCSRRYGAARMRAAMREFSKAMKGDSSARSATKISTSSRAIRPRVQPQLRLRGVRLGGACSG